MIGKRLNSLRKEKGITQQRLAKELGVRQNLISKWETNFIEPNLDYLVLIARYFDISTDYLLGVEDEAGRKTYSKAQNFFRILCSGMIHYELIELVINLFKFIL